MSNRCCASRRIVFRLMATLFFVAGSAAWSQQSAGSGSAARGLEPVFPVENETLVLVEGEDAASTNFAREPVLNFGCSGFRTIQLNRTTGLEGVGSFYADFVFTIPSEGTYELWYGGTPPGPKDELYPSYASPFRLVVDAAAPLSVYQESAELGAQYTPAYYLVHATTLPMGQGRHKVRFEVTEKRRIDGRYYFYLDCFFLVKVEGGKRVLAEPLPAVFPRNLDDRTANASFLTIDDYLIRIRDNPGSTEALRELSLVYALLGDYLNALKYLNRAAAIQPREPEILHLVAKNRIWKGDTLEGLKKYRELLATDPTRRDVYLEAGKVAAWTGHYDESIRFFSDGLAAFPGDMDLALNLGLTYLWASKGQEAEGIFRETQQAAAADSVKLRDMGRAYRVNGYPERAIQAYNAAMAAAPREIESYLLLIETWQTLGNKAEAAKAEALIASTFVPSERLTSYMESYREKQGLKEQLLAEYGQKLQENPDNLVLRQVLAQSYFWNGQKGRAIEEYRHILSNHAYISISDMETKSADLLRLIDRGYVMADYFARVSALSQQTRSSLASALARQRQAMSVRDTAQKSLATANSEVAARRAAADAELQSPLPEGSEAAKQKQKEQRIAQLQADLDKSLSGARAAEDAVSAAESALSGEQDAFSTLIADARALLAQFDDLRLTAEADRATTSALREQDAKDQEAFSKVTASIGWQFDRAGTMTELARDQKENALARLVSAKILMMDRQTAAAQALLARDGAEVGSGTTAQYTLAQTYLWSSKVGTAVTAISMLVENPGTAALPQYAAELARLAKSLEAPPEAGSALSAGKTISEAGAATEALSMLEKDAPRERDLSLKNAVLLHAIYARAMIRAFFSFEQNTSSIRNELGDYYLAENDLDNGIAQFIKVLAIDPNDLSATFRLGKVYQWKRDWRKALDAYGRVYAVDPYFENVAVLYNQVAREHSDSVGSLAYYLADPTRVQWHSEATYVRLFDSVWGLALAYQSDAMRIQREINQRTERSMYQIHDISVGLPIDLYLANLKVTPSIGGILSTNDLYSWKGGTGPTGTGGSLGVSTMEPYAKLDLGLGLWNALFLNATLRGGRQPETFDPLRTAIYDGSVEANLTTLFGFIDAWPFRDMSLRTYAKVDYLVDAGFAYRNLLSTALGELNVNLLQGGNPYSVLALMANVTFQSSERPEPYDYYAPQDVLIAGGGVTGSTWIGIGAGDVLGASLRLYGGTFQEQILDPSKTIGRWKLEAETNLSLTRGEGTFSVTGLATATYNEALVQPWDYWSAFIRLSFSTKLPKILAP